MNNRIRVEFGVESGVIKLTYRDQKGDHSLYAADPADAARAALELSARYGRLSPMLGSGIDTQKYTDIMREVRKQEHGRNGGSEYFYGDRIRGGKPRHLVVREGVKIVIGDDSKDDLICEEAKNLAS